MQPSRRASLLSAFFATVLIGPHFLSVTSERGVLFVLLLWVLCLVAFFRGFMKLEILWFMDRDWKAKRAERMSPPSQ